MANNYEKTDKIISFSIDDNDMVFITDYRVPYGGERQPLVSQEKTHQMDAYEFVELFKEPKFAKKYERIKRSGVDDTHIKYTAMPKKASRVEYEGSAYEIIIDTMAPSYKNSLDALNDAMYQVNVENNPNSKQNRVKNFKTAVAAVGLSAALLMGMYSIYDYTYNGKFGLLDFLGDKLSGKTSTSASIGTNFNTSEQALNTMIDNSGIKNR